MKPPEPKHPDIFPNNPNGYPLVRERLETGANNDYDPTIEEFYIANSVPEKWLTAMDEGISPGALYQQDAHSEGEENVRDEILHKVGKAIGTDLEGALDGSNPKDTGMLLFLTPEDANLFNLAGGSNTEPLKVPAIVRLIEFGVIGKPNYTYKLSEIEVPTSIVGEDGKAEEGPCKRILNLEIFPSLEVLPPTETVSTEEPNVTTGLFGLGYR